MGLDAVGRIWRERKRSCHSSCWFLSSVVQSVSAFVAQNVGAGNLRRARKGIPNCDGIWMRSRILIFWPVFGGEYLSAPFTSDREVIVQAPVYLKDFQWTVS